MDHLEAIVEIKNIISQEFINRIIPLIDKKAKKNLPVLKGVNTDVRKVKGYQLNLKSKTDTIYWNYIKKEIEKLFIFYTAKFPKMSSSKINQIDLLKYSSGGKYEIHTDHYTDTPRHLSVIMNLNNSYKGGDLIFTDQTNKKIKKIKLDKKTIIFFPSNFMYPHGIEPIIKGTRYSIVAWLQ